MADLSNYNPSEYIQHVIDTSTFSGADISIHAMIDHSVLDDYLINEKRNTIEEENEIALSDRSTIISSDYIDDLIDSRRTEERRATFYPEDKSNDLRVFKKLGEVSTISYSIYRDKERASALGAVMPKGFTRGEGTIAGTMVFTVFHERILHEIMNFSFDDNLDPSTRIEYMRIDQLPPIDIFITFSNEVGAKSRLAIYGVDFMNEGQVMSIQDLMTENSVNYVARNFAPMHNVKDLKIGLFDLQLKNRIMGGGISMADYKYALDKIKQTKSRWL